VRLYYTLGQKYVPDESDVDLNTYLIERKIHYTAGADLASELETNSAWIKNNDKDLLIARYTILAEEYELTAISLAVGGVHVLENRSYLNLKNRIRKCFKWMLK